MHEAEATELVLNAGHGVHVVASGALYELARQLMQGPPLAENVPAAQPVQVNVLPVPETA